MSTITKMPNNTKLSNTCFIIFYFSHNIYVVGLLFSRPWAPLAELLELQFPHPPVPPGPRYYYYCYCYCYYCPLPLKIIYKGNQSWFQSNQIILNKEGNRQKRKWRNVIGFSALFQKWQKKVIFKNDLWDKSY